MRIGIFTLLVWLTFSAVAPAQQAQEMQVYELQNRDAASLVNVAQQMVGATGRVSVDTQSNALIVLATPAQQEQLQIVIEQLDGVSRQVSMTVYVTEVSESFVQEYGLRSSGSIVLDDPQFSVVLDLLDRKQGGKITNSLTATTMSNRPAYLQISSDKFTTTPQGSGGPEAVERVPVGEFLEVLPRVNGDGSIQVALTPTVTRVGADDDVIKRTATTNVVVQDGQTIAIGGSSVDEDTRTVERGSSAATGTTQSSRRVMIFLTATTKSSGQFIPEMQDIGGDYSGQDFFNTKSAPQQRMNQDTRNPVK